jgi:hypothetical protein
MAQPTLQQLFGANCSQTSTQFIIDKSDLEGLTPSENNSAESLLVAILKKAAVFLTPEKAQADTEIQVSIERGSDNITTRNNQQFRQYNFTLELYKLDASTDIDPDDY